MLKKYIGEPLPLRVQRKMRNRLKEHQVILPCIRFYWEIAGLGRGRRTEKREKGLCNLAEHQ